MKAFFEFLRAIADVAVPRFMTEDVALQIRDGGYHIVCCMADIEEGEIFDGVATVRMFNFFGAGLWPKMVGEVRDWPT